MSQLNTFISASFRPAITGGFLDKSHTTKFFIENKNNLTRKKIHVNAVCFGPKSDRVLMNFEHAICEEDNILVFYYEDIHKRWTYQCHENEQYFIYKKNTSEELIVNAHTLYIRGCYIDPKDEFWTVLGYFYNFVELCGVKLVCSPNNQLTNESKLFQLNNSLLKSSKDNELISIGKSFVIKRVHHQKRLDKRKSYIVKSLSGIRSIVVDNQEFSQWETNNLNSLPVLFQEKIDGNDLRAHVVKNKIYAKISSTKDNVDYRYDDSFFKMSAYENIEPELEQFILQVTKHEQNRLMGIDFIKTGNKYTVLEANPSPGWSAYHECRGVEKEPFVADLIEELTNG